MLPNHDTRLVMEPTGSRDGILHGAWWPRSRDLRRELPGLITTLRDSLGPILRVRVDPDAWDDCPDSLVINGGFLRIGESPTAPGTVLVIRGSTDSFLLLVVPPDTASRVARAAMSAVASSPGGIWAPPRPRVYRMRPYASADQAAVLELVNADRIQGQAPCSAKIFAAAVVGRPPGLEPPRTEVMVDSGGAVIGVISSATRTCDGAGIILWLHGHELGTVIEPLVRHTLGRFGPRRAVEAFPGLGALPVGHRPVTRRVVENAGFASRDSWHYLHSGRRELTLIRTSPHVQVVTSLTPRGWWLTTPEYDLGVEAVAEAPTDGLGVLWWLGTNAAHAAADLDRELLDQALVLLYANGATEVVVYAEGAPSVFETSGFKEIDQLMSYARPAAAQTGQATSSPRARRVHSTLSHQGSPGVRGDQPGR